MSNLKGGYTERQEVEPSAQNPTAASPPTAPGFDAEGHSQDVTPGGTGLSKDSAARVTVRRADESASLDNTLATLESQAGEPSSLSSADILPFQNWERYKIIALLGQGGMGSVYKAHDPRLKRTVAIKFLRGGQVDATMGTRQRRHFEREAQTQAKIDHPHICKIYEVGEIEKQPYIVMQFIDGVPLTNLQKTIARDELVRQIQKISEALHVAHSQHLIHRDIKPGNVMVECRQDGTYWPYLMDFGLAKEIDGSAHTTTAGAEGTPAFMSPEQARGENKRLDRRTDIYGLGATLFAMLAGRPPFIGHSMDVLVAVLTQDPPRLRSLDPTIPVALETIVQKCLEKDPTRRYETAESLAQDLGRYLQGTQIAAKPPSFLRRTGRFARRHKLMVVGSGAALVASLILGGVALRIRLQAAEQAKLAQRRAAEQARLSQQLGQEITKMEWLLRSARQLPLHDLGREKKIIQRRMQALQGELIKYGEIGAGLAHYALGRGYFSLHEYPQALTELMEAQRLGQQEPELHYVLGLVQGKHFEEAMYEARLAGGGDWAKKRSEELAIKYLQPALSSLEQSRKLMLDSPHYLEGQIAYYKRDYKRALEHAEASLREAPWLYEALKLQGDVHLELALSARDTGKHLEAEREFANAVKAYESAAAIGQSDGEVYEGLAEAWVRQVEMASHRTQPTDAAYAAAVAACEKLAMAEPNSIASSLKRAFAAVMTFAVMGTGNRQLERFKDCKEATQKVLAMQPGHPYAADLAANCIASEAFALHAQGENPEPRLRQALKLLEPALAQHPQFLWGRNDLGNIQVLLGMYLQLRGDPATKELLEMSFENFKAALALDPSYNNGAVNSLSALGSLILEIKTWEEAKHRLADADDFFRRCLAQNTENAQCYNNYFQVYARAARLQAAAEKDPLPYLLKAQTHIPMARKLGGKLLDAEQHAAMVYLVQATDLIKRHKAPAPALAEFQTAIANCLSISNEDAACRTFDAQAEWVEAEFAAQIGLAALPHLKAALQKATLATESPEKYPDAWQTLAETHLRLAKYYAQLKDIRAQTHHMEQGRTAAERAFAINPHHTASLLTQGKLELLRAQTDMKVQAEAARAAVKALTKALEHTPLFRDFYAAPLETARKLANKS